MSVASITQYTIEQSKSTLTFLPYLVAAIIVLLVGWVLGRLIGWVVKVIITKTGFDAYVLKSPFGPSFQKTGVTIAYLGDIIVRVFVYFITIIVAAEILNIEALTKFLQEVVAYIPNIIIFAIILLAGFVLIDYLAALLAKLYGGLSFFGLVDMGLRLFLYLVVVILALSQLGIDLTIIYTFVTPIAWGIGIGVGAGIAVLLGYGLKDRAPQVVDEFLKEVKK